MADMDATEPSRRPWLTHERTVLLAIALIVAFGLGWLGWQFSIVVHRRSTLAQIRASGGRHPGQYQYQVWMHSFGTVTIRAREHGIPKIRKVLGDRAVGWIAYDHPLTPADRQAIEAFPEAAIYGPPSSPVAATHPLT
jgi:hypothetical protein